jgi:mannose-6-phosphate isomerase-like protein (cupin superfamily)
MEFRATAQDGMTRAERSGEERYGVVLEHGSLEVGYYAPRGADTQTPHTRDEIYMVVSGSGRFYCCGKETAVSVGDVLFVPAGEEHRFSDFTPDLGLWVMFYGPEGGEKTAKAGD